MNKRQQKRMKRNAAKAPRWVRDIAAAKFDPHGNRRHREAKLGTFGAASEVRHIDPHSLLSSLPAANSPAQPLPTVQGTISAVSA